MDHAAVDLRLDDGRLGSLSALLVLFIGYVSALSFLAGIRQRTVEANHARMRRTSEATARGDARSGGELITG